MVVGVFETYPKQVEVGRGLHPFVTIRMDTQGGFGAYPVLDHGSFNEDEATPVFETQDSNMVVPNSLSSGEHQIDQITRERHGETPRGAVHVSGGDYPNVIRRQNQTMGRRVTSERDLVGLTAAHNTQVGLQ